MRLFRGQSVLPGGSSRFGLTKSAAQKNNGDGLADGDSIGSSIAPSDQFDIIIPYKSPRHGWAALGDRRDDDTDVSSLTNDEYRYGQPGAPVPAVYQSQSSYSSTLCCCSAMPVDSAQTTDNTMVTSRGPPRTDAAVVRGMYDHDRRSNNDKSNMELFQCCGSSTEPTDVTPATCSNKRFMKRKGQRSLNRSHSLFDIISDDDEYDNDYHSTGGIRRFGKTLRRAMPWKRRQLAE